VTHQFAYELTTGSGASEILALNDHAFLVDELMDMAAPMAVMLS